MALPKCEENIGRYFETNAHSLIAKFPSDGGCFERWLLLLERIASSEKVYVARAQDSKHGIVAVKFASAAAIEREAGILKELTFAGLKGIARGYGNWLVHPFNAITMQYYETNVASMVYLRGPMQWKCVAEMGKDIISTLRDVHRMGIIHGDVKPGNIVTTTTAQSFYLIDWGYARRKSELVPDYPVGTPAYMSLRVLTGMLNDERDDLESLLYTLLYAGRGELPWALNEPRTESDLAPMAREREAFLVEGSSSICPDVLQRFLDMCREESSSIEGTIYEDLTTLLDSL